jgi:hypothetical protein
MGRISRSSDPPMVQACPEITEIIMFIGEPSHSATGSSRHCALLQVQQFLKRVSLSCLVSRALTNIQGVTYSPCNLLSIPIRLSRAQVLLRSCGLNRKLLVLESRMVFVQGPRVCLVTYISIYVTVLLKRALNEPPFACRLAAIPDFDFSRDYSRTSCW